MADTFFEPKPKMPEDPVTKMGQKLKSLDYDCKKCKKHVLVDWDIRDAGLDEIKLCPDCVPNYGDCEEIPEGTCPCGEETSETPLGAPYHRLCDGCKADKEFDDSVALQWMIEMFGGLTEYKKYMAGEDSDDEEYDEGPWDDF